MAHELPAKLRVTMALLGCNSRKELCARFREVNPRTEFDLERSHKWLQGRAKPRTAQVYEDWTRLLGMRAAGGLAHRLLARRLPRRGVPAVRGRPPGSPAARGLLDRPPAAAGQPRAQPSTISAAPMSVLPRLVAPSPRPVEPQLGGRPPGKGAALSGRLSLEPADGAGRAQGPARYGRPRPAGGAARRRQRGRSTSPRSSRAVRPACCAASCPAPAS